MLDYTNCNIVKVSVHSVGNKTNNEELFLSKSLLDISDNLVKNLLFKFFLSPFSTPEFYSFTFSNQDFTLNPVFKFAYNIFENEKTFHNNSVNIAKLLYELSIHPQIKSGDLFVTYFTNIVFEDKTIDAVGIFKSENRQAFLKLNNNNNDFSINYNDGINVDKLDKGCIIFNTDKDSGFKVCVVDKSNKLVEAQYWKDNFLQLKPCSDDYHQTKDFLTIAKNFVTKRLSQEFEVSKADKIDLLNRSVEYFKTNDTFDKSEFENEVFQSNDVITSFRSFDDNYRENNEIEMPNTFDISPQAVKKQTKFFKSVLKLDKNFHIYIHGDRQFIEKGFDDASGMNYYKVFFKEEK